VAPGILEMVLILYNIFFRAGTFAPTTIYAALDTGTSLLSVPIGVLAERGMSQNPSIPVNSPLICQLYMGYDDMGIIEYGSNIGISIRYQSESIPSVIWVKIGYPMKLWMLGFFCVLEISINRPVCGSGRPQVPNFDPHRKFLG
jgi:hypothetical protein